MKRFTVQYYKYKSWHEVIIIDLHHDCYVLIVRMAGGLPLYITLKSFYNNNNEKWSLDFNKLESKFK